MSTVALLGCTHPHSRMHLASLRVSPRVERIWLWDADRAAAEGLAGDAGPKLAGATGDLAAALQDEVGFALVCRRNDLNPDTVVAAARAGKHVLSEKPVARTAALLRPVLEAVRAAGVGLAVCYPWRCHPVCVDLRGLIERGILGRIIAAEARMVTSQVKFRNPSHWLFSPEQGGGGILHWLGCHYLDLLRYLLSDDVVEVSALTGRLGGEAIEVEDTASLALRFRSGAIASFTAGYHLPRSTSGYSGAAYDTYLAARGLEGNFRWTPTRGDERVRVESAHPDWATAPERELGYRLEPSEAYGGSYGLEMLHAFLDSPLAANAGVASGEDALQVLRILDAAYESARSGRTIHLTKTGKLPIDDVA